LWLAWNQKRLIISFKNFTKLLAVVLIQLLMYKELLEEVATKMMDKLKLLKHKEEQKKKLDNKKK